MSLSLQLAGSLDDIPLPDIARLLQSTRRTGELYLTMDQSIGSVFFERGDIIDSQSHSISGLDALKHLALFNRGNFEFHDNVPSPTRGLAETPTAELIRILETRMQESRQIFELMPGPGEIPRYLGGAIPPGFEVNAAELAIAMKSAGGTLGTAQLAHDLQLDLTMVRYTLARFRAVGLVDIMEGEAPVPAEYRQQPPPLPEMEAPAEEAPAAAPEETAAPAPPSEPRYWRGRRIG